MSIQSNHPTIAGGAMLVFERLKTETDVTNWKPLVMRARVPGGWLVLGGGERGMTFMPDLKHEWDGSSLLDPNQTGGAAPD